VISKCFSQLEENGRQGAVRFMFSQVGSDGGAQRYLAALDKDKQVGNYVDVVSGYELEKEECFESTRISLTHEGWICKLLLGGIDPKYDSLDEQKHQAHSSIIYHWVDGPPSLYPNECVDTPIDKIEKKKFSLFRKLGGGK
jgi:hypothetical protein